MKTVLHYVWLPLTVISYAGFWCAVAYYFMGPEFAPVGILSVPIAIILAALSSIGADLSR